MKALIISYYESVDNLITKAFDNLIMKALIISYYKSVDNLLLQKPSIILIKKR
jgi:hypothetical protein